MIDKNIIGNLIVKYKRQTAVACILLCLVIVTAVTLIGKKKGQASVEADTTDAMAQNEQEEEDLGAVVSAVGSEEGTVAVETNILEKDAYEDVNTIVRQYYDYMSSGDMEGLATVVDEINDDERNRILGSQGLVEGYQNISCYTKKGLEEGSHVVFVCYDLKFQQIETPAPGLSPLYVYTNEEGNLCIMKKEPSKELTAYVEEIADGEDVKALREEVKQRYEEAKATDEALAKQEERYVRLSSEPEEEPTEVADAGEETPADGEGTEAPAEGEEEPEEEPEPEAPAQTGEATTQNRDTRFTESVRLRAQPSTEAEYLGTAYQGEHVTQIESYGDGWSKIKYNDKECYCKTEFLE